MLRRADRTTLAEIVVAAALGLAVMTVLWIVAAHGEKLAPDDWFALAVRIQRDVEQADFERRPLKSINAEDRRFIRKMINDLSVSPDAKPTAAQAQWLLAIQEWVREK